MRVECRSGFQSVWTKPGNVAAFLLWTVSRELLHLSAGGDHQYLYSRYGKCGDVVTFYDNNNPAAGITKDGDQCAWGKLCPADHTTGAAAHQYLDPIKVIFELVILFSWRASCDRLESGNSQRRGATGQVRSEAISGPALPPHEDSLRSQPSVCRAQSCGRSRGSGIACGLSFRNPVQQVRTVCAHALHEGFNRVDPEDYG